MDLFRVLILIATIGAVFCIALLIVYNQCKRDEKEIMDKWAIFFDIKRKKFVEHHFTTYEENENEVLIYVSHERLLYSFLAYCELETYHITTLNQARKVFDIYLKVRKCELEGETG